MNNQKKGAVPAIVVVVLLIIIVGGGFYLYSAKKAEMPKQDEFSELKNGAQEKEEGLSEMENEKMMDNEEGMMAERKMMGGEERMMSSVYSGTTLAGSLSPLLDFTKADYDKAIQSGKPILLYFYASWCPICKKETADALYPAFNEFKREGVIGFRVNYKDGDTDKDEVALAREFGVPYQHTKILLQGGKMFLKSPESWDKARYTKEITTLLE